MAMRLVGLAVFAVGAAAEEAAAFVHPGVLVSQKQLDFVRSQVQAKSGPIYDAFVKATKSKEGSLSYQVRGPPSDGVVECGSYSNPNIGCSDEDKDSEAAYLQSVLWTITGTKRYAENSIKIMNTWSAHLKDHTNSNAPLQSGWSSCKWSKAAEIIAHTGAGWSQADKEAFATMLKKRYLPKIVDGSGSNGNWELAMLDGMIGIAVFTDDRDLFNRAIGFWRERVPAYFYIHTDGSKPIPAPRGHPTWYGQKVFDKSVDGICQETCRDLGHTTMGFSATINVAETAFVQGVDLYGAEKARLTAAMEFHSKLETSSSVPKDVCGGHVKPGEAPTFEIAYNHFHNRLGMQLPLTLKNLEEKVRTNKDPSTGHVAVYETLTHGGNAAASMGSDDLVI